MNFYEKETNLFYIYFQIIKKYKKFMEESLENFNLSPAEIDVVTFLLNNKDKEITAKDISNIRGISKGLVSRAVTSLKFRKIIKIKENPKDKRSVFLEINHSENKDLVKKISDTNDYFINILSKDINNEEFKIFIDINNKMLSNVKKI